MGGRHVIVTGSETGIGAACARAFGAEGARVSLFVYDEDEQSRASAEAVRKAGGEPFVVQCDVAKEDSVRAATDAAVGRFGAPDVLVNSAGVNMAGVDVRDMELDQWYRGVGTDLTGAFLITRAFLNACPDGSALIHISSIHADVVRGGGADYCAAKAGLDNLVRTVALEEAGRGTRVNAILPGMILTPMNQHAVEDEAYRESLTKNIPMKRAGEPGEVADLAVFLAGPKAGYITGACFTIDGALSLLLGQGA